MSHKLYILLVAAALFIINIIAFIRMLQGRKRGVYLFLLTMACSGVLFVGLFYRDLLRLYHRWQNSATHSSCFCKDNNLALPKDTYDMQMPKIKKRFPDYYLENDNALKQLLRQGRIAEIHESAGYEIDDLDYSVPYLHTESKELLEELGRRFQEEIHDKGMQHGIFRVHSVTRTESQQEKVRKNNPRTATKARSAHSYCLAIDISKIEVSGNCDMGMDCLEKVLLEMRNEGKLYVIPESSNLHVTFLPSRLD